MSKTNSKAVFPLPVKRYMYKRSGKMYKLEKADIDVFFAKIGEEMVEAMMLVALNARDFEEYDGKPEPITLLESVNRAAAEEVVNVITACVTTLERLGYDEADRQELYRKVNEKNKARGYFDE